MPTIDIGPRVRLALYLLAAVALLVVAYAVDKSWAGDAEVRLVTGLAALLNILAASKVDLHPEQSARELVARTDGDAGYADGRVIIVVAVFLAVILVLALFVFPWLVGQLQ